MSGLCLFTHNPFSFLQVFMRRLVFSRTAHHSLGNTTSGDPNCAVTLAHAATPTRASTRLLRAPAPSLASEAAVNGATTTGVLLRPWWSHASRLKVPRRANADKMLINGARHNNGNAFELRPLQPRMVRLRCTYVDSA
jgi:hypothetical protein